MQQGHHAQSAIASRAAQQPNHPTAPTQAEIEHAITLADAALGAAGHEVTDEETRELGRQIAAGAITGNDAAARLVAKLRSKPSDQPS